jgi:hypothetical protein
MNSKFLYIFISNFQLINVIFNIIKIIGIIIKGKKIKRILD